MKKSVQLVLMMVSLATVALAIPVPEIDGGSAVSAIGLLSCGLLLLAPRRK